VEHHHSDSVQSLKRGLAVIRTFGREARHQTLSEVAQRTGMTRAAARRFLHTLAELGYVHFDGKHFRLTARVLDLGYAYLSSTPLSDAVQPYIEQVSAKLQESCAVCVLEGTDIVYVAGVTTNRIVTVTVAAGLRASAHATSAGQVLLAHLPPEDLERYFASVRLERFTPHTITDPHKLRGILKKVKRQGWAFGEQEVEPGVRSIAVPIRDRDGRVVAAMALHSISTRITAARARSDILPVLAKAAASISKTLAVSLNQPVR
jgi:IclR family transcriptional regulator, pca regulon regulatory protein